jgi:serine/threonine protein kinase
MNGDLNMNHANADEVPTTKIPILPGYTAKRLLGSGAFGEVWLAQDMCGLFYAVKVIYRENSNHPDGEAQELNGLRHYLGVSRENDNLIQIYFVGPALDHRFFYYVMELADDANGRDRIRVAQYVPRTLSYDIKSRAGHSSVREVIRLGQALLHGLQYLHENHLIHRDLKPSNIIFSRGEPKLTDFGLVCVPSKWSRAECIGTLYYAPDRGKGTHGADLYSLGKVLWAYWTGRDIADFPSIPYEFLENSPKGASNRLNEIINRACEEEPSKRYHGWKEMWDDLTAIDPSPPTQVRAPMLPEPEPSFSLPAAPVGVINRYSSSYIRREADQRVREELQNCQKQGGLIRIKGPRQFGKTSLLARALEEARDGGFQVVMADFRQLNEVDFIGLDEFYRAFAQLIARSVNPEDLHYDSDIYYGPNQRLTEFMESQVFTRLRGSVLLAMDNIERLIVQPYSQEVYSLIRSWYEYRETRKEPWRRFTQMLTYSDDELILEKRMKDQSPFNVGIRIELGGLTLADIEHLNRAYNSPLASSKECASFFRLTGGQPFLVSSGLYEMARGKVPFDEFESAADQETGPYRDKLRWVRRRIETYGPKVAAACQGKSFPDEQTFLELESLGILTGSRKQPRFSCELYSRFFSRYFESAIS